MALYKVIKSPLKFIKPGILEWLPRSMASDLKRDTEKETLKNPWSSELP